jgi:hypothetical protein
MTPITPASLWERVARAGRIDGIYGEPFHLGVVTPVPAAVAPLFAAAHQRVLGRRAAVHHGQGVLVFPAREPGPRRVLEAGSPEALIAAVAAVDGPGELELRVTLGPDELVADVAPGPAPLDETWIEPPSDASALLRRARSVVILAGPSVVHQGAVPGLHDLAVAGGLGVLNTWGAKGVFHWRSRHHLATVGLQADDFQLSGLAEVDLIIATGLDPAESPEAAWRLAPALSVPPAALAPVAERWIGGPGVPAVPLLRTRLADVTQRGWGDPAVPMPPSRVTLHYAECLAEGALIAADAGLAGFWVARTLGTPRLGAVIVPSTARPGFAAACIAVARLRRPSQAALAVVDGPPDPATVAVVAAAAALGVPVPLEAWGPDGDRLDAESHRARLRRMVLGGIDPDVGVATLATDSHQMTEMIEAAGAVVAWT